MGSSRRRARAGRPLVVLLVAAIVLGALPAGASEPPPDGAEGAELVQNWAPRRVGTIAVPNVSGGLQSFWAWGAGNRGYALADLSGTGFNQLRSYDLDTLREAPWVTLDPPAFAANTSTTVVHYGAGAPATIAVDEDEGRLFVAHTGSMVTASTSPTSLPGMAAGIATGTAHVCEGDGVAFNGGVINCFGGVHVLDASTLEPLRASVPLRAVRTDTSGLKPILRAMTYAPPRPGLDENGKVLLLVEDWQAAGMTTVAAAMPRLNGFNLVYAVQLDPVTGAQDWAVRLEACNGTRETAVTQNYAGRNYGHPSAIFRSESVSDPAVYVACHTGTSQTGVVVKLALDGQGNAAALPVRTGPVPSTGEPGPSSGGTAPDPAASMPQSTSPSTAVGPTHVFRQIADPVRERVLMQSMYGDAEVWWVFDTARFAFIGTIGIGAIGSQVAAGGRPAFDAISGRLYVQGKARTADGVGGLFVTDTAGEPLSQALVFSDGWPVATGGDVGDGSGYLASTPPRGNRPPLLLAFKSGAWEVFEDRVPLGRGADGGAPAEEDAVGLTLDLDEVEGATRATFDGTARGYGARAVLVGGLEAAGRVDRFDPGWWYQAWTSGLQALPVGTSPVGTLVPGINQGGTTGSTIYRPVLKDRLGLGPSHPCSQANRELVLAFVGPEGDAVVDAAGSRGAAQPVRFDSGMQADTELPVSRCSWLEWSDYWNVGLFGRPPVDEPSPSTQGLRSDIAQCISTDETPAATAGDAVGASRAAQAECGAEEASGYGYVRGVTVAGNHLGEALSSFRIYRDPGRGIVSRVESVARGINIAGVAQIDTVRGAAESWANGRRQPVAAANREAGYDPNCDMDRSAGTCFRRHVFGVRAPGYSCGPCGDEAALAEGLSRALGTSGRVRLRQPDTALAAGSEDGYQAAVLKPVSERFTDAAIHNDFLTTVVPALEIVRYAPPAPPPNGGSPTLQPVPGPRGLQVYQFAGVAVSSTYGIQCLLVYDAAGNTCEAATEPPGSLTVSLATADGEPLAGGSFEVRVDADGDGTAGLADALVPGGACVTAEGGIGTCAFDGLAPGGYLVTQVAAPPGYAKVTEPYPVTLGPGEARTVAFTNATNLSTIQVRVRDEAGAPLAGAAFAVYADPDADGKVAPGTQPTSSCVSDQDGGCVVRVPTGNYVLVQTAAPAGLEPVEPVAFALTAGGQIATVEVVNFPPGAGGVAAPAPAPGPVAYQPGPDLRPVETVRHSGRPGPSTPAVALPSLTQQVGGTVVRIVQAPGDTLHLLVREPRQAAALAAIVLLLAFAAMAIRRRYTLTLLAGPA